MKKIVRYKFEEKDFEGCGQIIIRNSALKNEGLNHDKASLDFAISVTYMAGYLKRPKKYCLVSLADGWTRVFDTMKDLVDTINEDSSGYSPLNSEDLAAVMGQRGNKF